MDQEIDENPTKSFRVRLVLLNSVSDEAIDQLSDDVRPTHVIVYDRLSNCDI